MRYSIPSKTLLRGARAIAVWFGRPSASSLPGPPGSLEHGAWTEEAIAADLEAFVRLRSHVSDDDPRFSRENNLWQDGYLDSIGVVELIGHIEAAFGVDVPDETLFDPAFTSVTGIAGVVRRLPRARTI